jgi:hypothetical protein
LFPQYLTENASQHHVYERTRPDGKVIDDRHHPGTYQAHLVELAVLLRTAEDHEPEHTELFNTSSLWFRAVLRESRRMPVEFLLACS